VQERARRHAGDVDRAVDAVIEREIRALAEGRGVLVVVATREVARAWYDDALAQGVSLLAADEVRRYVHLVGAGIARSEPERLRHHPR
jgi:predicted RNA-binding protein with PIN domain